MDAIVDTFSNTYLKARRTKRAKERRSTNKHVEGWLSEMHGDVREFPSSECDHPISGWCQIVTCTAESRQAASQRSPLQSRSISHRGTRQRGTVTTRRKASRRPKSPRPTTEKRACSPATTQVYSLKDLDNGFTVAFRLAKDLKHRTGHCRYIDHEFPAEYTEVYDAFYKGKRAEKNTPLYFFP
jgi:hypothetical protein